MISGAGAAGFASGTLLQILPSAAGIFSTIAAGLISGFGAAALKHKWDSEADDRRWRRENAGRRRTELLSAFAQYLTARPSLSVARSLADDSGNPAIAISAIRLAAANLMILLPAAEQQAVVVEDLQAVEQWIVSWATPSSRASWTDVPSDHAVMNLAWILMAQVEGEPGVQRDRKHGTEFLGRL